MFALDFDLSKYLPVIITGLGGWGAAWLTNRRERRQWLEKQELEQNRQLQVQSERLTTGWSEMTTQAREIIDRLQTETIAAAQRAAAAELRCSAAEARNRDLEVELEGVRQMYRQAQRDLEDLRTKGARRRAPETGERPRPKPGG